jgi:hypothetical protein
MTKMYREILAILFLFSTCINAWEIEDSYEDPGGFLLHYREEPISDLQEAVKNEERVLRSIFLGRLVNINSQSIQSEIMSYLNAHDKVLLAQVLQSSGNMHSLNMSEFHGLFKSALLNTKFIKSIDAVLKAMGYGVESANFEKFFFIKEGDAIQFDALTWLTVEQLTYTGSGR